MSELKPCPFCGSIYVNDTSPPEMGEGCMNSWVCPDCAAVGPAALTEIDATNLWNTRTPDPRVVELEAENEDLKEHLWQCVDDFRDGLNVCGATRDAARKWFLNNPLEDYPLEPLPMDAELKEREDV